MLQPDSCEYSLVSGMPTFNFGLGAVIRRIAR
jgi:hypothetical protein